MNPNTIPAIHSLYCHLSGLSLKLGYDRERAWHLFLKAGFDAEDLSCVLLHLRAGMRKGYRHPGCLRFTTLIWNLDTFEEALAEARAYVRNNQPQTNRQSVIRVFRPVAAEATGPTVSCKPVGSIVPELIRKLREAAK